MSDIKNGSQVFISSFRISTQTFRLMNVIQDLCVVQRKRLSNKCRGNMNIRPILRENIFLIFSAKEMCRSKVTFRDNWFSGWKKLDQINLVVLF